MQFAGTKTDNMLCLSSSSMTFVVSCPWKWSKIASAVHVFSSSPRSSQTLVTKGTIMFSMYCSMVVSFDQCLLLCVMSQSFGKGVGG